VRITDRGPFVGDRVIDLPAAAPPTKKSSRKASHWSGIEVLETPAPIKDGGRGGVADAFSDARDASKLLV
jgi:hypothetical protein